VFGGSQHHPLVLVGAAIFVVGLVYFIFIKNPKILDKLLGRNLSDIGPGFVGATVGTTVAGPNIYTPTGDISTGAVITIRSGGSSFRDNVSYDCAQCARETTWFVNPGGGGDLSVKMGSHGDESDDTSLIQYSTDGQKWRCEGPHMTYNDLSGEGSVDVGSEPVGIKGISWNVSGGTNHHEIWVSTDAGANWTCAATYEGGADGCTEMACPVPDAGVGCQDTLRIDDPSGHSFTNRTMVGIDPGDGTPVGGGTPPTDIPNNEEESGAAGGGGGGGGGDDGGDDDGGDDSGGDDDDDDSGGDTGGEVECDEDSNQCTCADGTSRTLPSSQDCDDCETVCSGAAAAARRRRRGFYASRHLMRNELYNRTKIGYRSKSLFRVNRARLSI
jgi:hypothetical protein